MNIKVSIWWIIVGFLIAFFLLKKCEGEPKIVKETEYVYTDRTDTIVKTVIKEAAPKKHHIEIGKNTKGKDSIIYRDYPTKETITVNEYNVTVEADSSSANLKILSKTKPIDVTGFINWKEKETITTITETKPMSGLFLYAETSVQPVFERAELGLDFQIKNTFIVGTSISYNNINQQTYVNAKIGVNILNLLKRKQ